MDNEILKINRLEAHDRLLHLKKDQSLNIAKGAEDCLKTNKMSLQIQEKSPYVYLFAHPRTSEDGYTKRMIWQARLSRPSPQSNSYLFRALSKTDTIEVCWLIPPLETWDQYKKGNVTENDVVEWSINMFRNNRKALEDPHPADLSEEHGKRILQQIINEHKEWIKKEKLKNFLTPEI
jgi:hypothetical protein